MKLLFVFISLACLNLVASQDYISPREKNNRLDIIYAEDTLNLWNYDIIEMEYQYEMVPFIIFFRNKPYPKPSFSGKDLTYNNFFPAIYFQWKPTSDLQDIKNTTIDGSSCVGPDVGGGYIILKSFILVNTMSCVSCTNYSILKKNFTEKSEKKTFDNLMDLCRGNIKRILKPVFNKKYTSFESLLLDLPISRTDYKKFYENNN